MKVRSVSSLSLETRSSIPNTRFAILDPRFAIFYTILDSRYSMLDSQYSILDTRKCQVSRIESSIETRQRLSTYICMVLQHKIMSKFSNKFQLIKTNRLPSILGKAWLDSAALSGNCSDLYVIIRKFQHFTIWIILIERLVLQYNIFKIWRFHNFIKGNLQLN